MKIAYFGFAANPPHAGHLKVIQWLADQYDLVLVGAAASHAFGKQMAPLEIRKQLCEALLMSDPLINAQLTDIEETLLGKGPVFSYDVLVELRKRYPHDEIHLAVGPDNAEPEVWNRFHKADDILREFGRVIAPNMGSDFRSTNIRAKIQGGISFEELAECTTAPVAEILSRMPGLYSQK